MLADFLSNTFIDTVINKAQTASMPFTKKALSEETEGFSQAVYQIMIKDTARMNAYRKAIGNSVKGKTVVDIGTGAHAPLAIMCAEAGATKIYAIEANKTAFRNAKRLINKTGLSEKIEIMEGLSFDVELPGKADILVHELIGDLGSNEGMVKTIEDAKSRFMKNDHLIIPERCSVFCAPVELPDFTNPLFFKILSLIRATENFFSGGIAGKSFWNLPESCLLSEPICFEDVKFMEKQKLNSSRRLEFTIKEDSPVSGLVFWVRLHLDRATVLDCFRGTHWSSVFLPVFKNTMLKSGDRLSIDTSISYGSSTGYSFEPYLLRKDRKINLEKYQF